MFPVWIFPSIYRNKCGKAALGIRNRELIREMETTHQEQKTNYYQIKVTTGIESKTEIALSSVNKIGSENWVKMRTA